MSQTLQGCYYQSLLRDSRKDKKGNILEKLVVDQEILGQIGEIKCINKNYKNPWKNN